MTTSASYCIASHLFASFVLLIVRSDFFVYLFACAGFLNCVRAFLCPFLCKRFTSIEIDTINRKIFRILFIFIPLLSISCNFPLYIWLFWHLSLSTFVYVPNENQWELLWYISQLLWQFVWFPLNELCDFGLWFLVSGSCVCEEMSSTKRNHHIHLPSSILCQNIP